MTVKAKPLQLSLAMIKHRHVAQSGAGRTGQLVGATVKRPLSIALVIRNLAGVIGGAERSICLLANGLAAAGHYVTMVSEDPTDEEPVFPVDPSVKRINVFRPRPFSSFRKFYLRRAPYWRLRHFLQWRFAHSQFKNSLRKVFVKFRPDVVVAFMPDATTTTLLAARGTGIPVITSFRTDPYSDFVSPTMWHPTEYDRRLRLALLHEAAAVHVLMPDFVSFFAPEIQAKTVVIPNGVTPGIDRAVGTVPRRPLILGLGRLAAQKNFKDLIEAWAMIAADHPDWSVEIHGEGEERPMLEALIRDRGVGRSCRLPGATKDVPRLLASGSILCHPALFEGFPRAPTEALACGLTVVAYDDCPGLSALLQHEQNALLVPRSEGPAGLAAALDRLIRDEALRRRLSAAAPRSVAHFTDEACTAGWLDLIERVTSGRPVKDPTPA
ncbi:glycosyltransferase [Elioraea thermophila]|uniref:glycosyltransferase n=1 Tax=Elioraea thermophila TaxID=2185104 RepID=UPI0018E53DD4|nr:glycosyltransferase [Elioraea thermophila]